MLKLDWKSLANFTMFSKSFLCLLSFLNLAEYLRLLKALHNLLLVLNLSEYLCQIVINSTIGSSFAFILHNYTILFSFVNFLFLDYNKFLKTLKRGMIAPFIYILLFERVVFLVLLLWYFSCNGSNSLFALSLDKFHSWKLLSFFASFSILHR